jgi:hypothetical protein
MASGESPRTFVMAVGAVVVLGAVATLGTALLPGLALIFVGGSEYEQIRSRLWIFAVLGTVLAVLMMVVYALLARGGQRSVYLTWVALAAIIGFGLTVHTIGDLLTVVIAVDTVLVVVLLVAYQLSAGKPARAGAVTEPYPAG